MRIDVYLMCKEITEKLPDFVRIGIRVKVRNNEGEPWVRGVLLGYNPALRAPYLVKPGTGLHRYFNICEPVYKTEPKPGKRVACWDRGDGEVSIGTYYQANEVIVPYVGRECYDYIADIPDDWKDMDYTLSVNWWERQEIYEY